MGLLCWPICNAFVLFWGIQDTTKKKSKPSCPACEVPHVPARVLRSPLFAANGLGDQDAPKFAERRPRVACTSRDFELPRGSKHADLS